MRFWDASAIVPLCLEEPESSALRKIAQGDEAIVAWWGTPVECYSTFARLRREGILTSAAEDQARAVVPRIGAAWTEIQPSGAVRDGAGRALLLHPVRAADSLQLAAALVWAAGQPSGHSFVCLDQRLREAAQREGFRIFPERF